MKLGLMLLLLTGPAFGEVWNTATPVGTDPVSQGATRIREMKAAIQSALRGNTTDGLEAVFPGTAPLTAPAFHYRGLRGTEAERPTADNGGLYFNTSIMSLQRSNGSNWETISTGTTNSALYGAPSISLASSGGLVTLSTSGNSFHISGTESITQIGGWPSGGIAMIRWTQARTIAYHASNLILIPASTQTVTAGDISWFQFTSTHQVREVARLANNIGGTGSYIVGPSTANYFYGDGSGLTGITFGSGVGVGISTGSNKGAIVWEYAKSVDGATQSSGCLVMLGMSDGTDTAETTFTSTTTATLHGPGGILLESCAPGSVCKVAVHGWARVRMGSSVGTSAVNQGMASFTERCRAGYFNDSPPANYQIGIFRQVVVQDEWAWVYITNP